MSSDHDVSEALDVVENNLNQFSTKELTRLSHWILELLDQRAFPDTELTCLNCKKMVKEGAFFCDGNCLTAYNASKESALRKNNA